MNKLVMYCNILGFYCVILYNLTMYCNIVGFYREICTIWQCTVTFYDVTVKYWTIRQCAVNHRIILTNLVQFDNLQ
jgi:hypothetical protein